MQDAHVAARFPRDAGLDRFLRAAYAILMTLCRFLPPSWRLFSQPRAHINASIYIWYRRTPLPLFPMTAKVFGGNGWNWNSFHLSIFLLFDKNKCKNIGDWKILLSFSEYFLKIVNTYPLTRLLNFIPYITIFNVSRISRWLYIYSSSLSISNSINFSHRHRILHPSRTYIHPCFQSL